MNNNDLIARLREFARKGPGYGPVEKLADALEAKPVDCRGCLHFTVGMSTGRNHCTLLAKDCADGDKFQALPIIQLYKVTK